MSSKLSDYDYPLPEALIAKRPLSRRDESRMMVLHRGSQTIEHRQFRDLKAFLQSGDLLVLNNTRVLPARRFSDDHAVEFLFLEKLGSARWKCLVKPGRKMRAGATTKIDNVPLRVAEILPDGERVGALAAPTAGLHFTPEILAEIPHAFVTLHVGPGTFRPVYSENVAEHRMHAESFSISEEAAAKINQAERVIAVGTTIVRTLESAARKLDRFKRSSLNRTAIEQQRAETDIFIYPPFDFRVVDLLLTNFHLPRSTLLMLASAFAGREFLLRAYEEAIRQHYRFYSYGDCMLIL